MSKPRGGLGRGLDALIPSAPGGSAPEALQLDVSSIEPNPYQPRREWNDEELAELAGSIREHGVLQPVLVCRASSGSGATYTLVAGERRWRASRLAGLTHIPAVVRQVTPQQMLALALVENLQRADLNPLEEARAYQELMRQFSLTQDQVASVVGRSRAAVANILRLLGLPEDIQASLARGEITEGHARALLGAAGEEQTAIWRRALSRGLSVRETEQAVRSAARAPAPRAQDGEGDAPAAPEDRALEDAFRRALGTRVNLVRQGKRGRIVVHFYSEEQLQAIYERLIDD